jgi:hypothetical protein
MSLIPSESYSFPDHFTTTVVPSRKPKKEEPQLTLVETRQRPAIVPLPTPRPQPAPIVRRENPEPIRAKAPAPAPNPALRRVSAPPPRVPEAPVRKIALPPTLKPKVRWNMRAPAMDPSPSENGAEQIQQAPPSAPAQNVIQMRPARVPRPPRMMPPPPAIVHDPSPQPPAEPVAAVEPATPVQAQSVQEIPRAAATSNPQADFFEVFAQTGETALSKRRRKAKMRRFIVCESVALTVLLPLVILGLAHHPDNVALVWILNILTITSAVAAALLPIFFFAFTPTLPEIER